MRLSDLKLGKKQLIAFGIVLGLMAGVKACTNGCMSVDDRSCFSYQVAAGKRRSLYRPVLVMR